jgi:hypothetical protein
VIAALKGPRYERVTQNGVRHTWNGVPHT